MVFPARLPPSAEPLATSYLYSAAQVRALDKNAIEVQGVPGITLMKRAGKALFEALLNSWSEASGVAVFCGPGNNGGDGYIVAALAAQEKMQVQLVECAGSKLSGYAKTAREFAVSQGVTPTEAEVWLQNPQIEADSVIVDALLGTGFSGELRAPYKELIQLINASGVPVAAADIPSGLSADTGHVAEDAVQADLTVTFIGIKLGLLTGEGRAYCGDIQFDDLGVPPEVYEAVDPSASLLDLDSCLDFLPIRTAADHKGSNGHLLVIGGDLGYAGAPLMAAEAAARVGTGLVSVVTRPEHVSAMLARRPELMVSGADDSQHLQSLLDRCTTIVAGPGLGQGAWGQRLLQRVLAAAKPMVLDADALNLLASGQFDESLPAGKAVFTPHPGEAARLLGIAVPEVNRDRVAALDGLHAKLGGTVLLKGSGTIVYACEQAHAGVDKVASGMAREQARAGVDKGASGLAREQAHEGVEQGKFECLSLR